VHEVLKYCIFQIKIVFEFFIFMFYSVLPKVWQIMSWEARWIMKKAVTFLFLLVSICYVSGIKVWYIIVFTQIQDRY